MGKVHQTVSEQHLNARQMNLWPEVVVSLLLLIFIVSSQEVAAKSQLLNK
jgi:hypothetical protein